MLTKEEQKILDNAPDGAEWYAKAQSTYYEAYLNKDKSRIFVFHRKEWKDVERSNIARFKPLSDLRKKQGKTVVDAVNELKGDLINSAGIFEGVIDVYLIYSKNSGNYVTIDTEPNLRSSQLICTISEFNQCVKEMSYHAGREAFERYARHDKTPLTKLSPRDMYRALDEVTKKEGVKMMNQHRQSEDVPGVKPTYTQAMKDAGELPSVGMRCMWECGMHEDREVEILCISGDYHWILIDGQSHPETVGNISGLKPVDTRTDEQKQVDEYCGLYKECVEDSDELRSVIECMQSNGHLKELK